MTGKKSSAGFEKHAIKTKNSTAETAVEFGKSNQSSLQNSYRNSNSGVHQIE
jgi:hypothetical protein